MARITETARLTSLAPPFLAHEELLACPATGERLVAGPEGLTAGTAGRHYPVDEGIPRLFAATATDSASDVTELVKAFYEETPFPNYNDDDTRESLALRGAGNFLLSALDRELPPNAIVLEAGCGTGQMTNFLALAEHRTVFGGDVCLNSLRLANGFRDREGIANAGFLQMNLFRPPFRDAGFDMVISNGVLHHTANPRTGFEALLRKVKPGGFILIGLYNSYARLTTLWRRRIFARFGQSAHFLDRRLTSGRYNEVRWQAWFRDQYEHPHESRHSFDEVLSWFDQSGVEFVSSIPRADGGAFTAETKLFDPQSRGRSLQRVAVQLKLLATGAGEGGFFIMVGRKCA